MNRYNRKIFGKSKQKKRFTPYEYNSYAEYVSVSEEQELADYVMYPEFARWHDERMRRSGDKPYYKRYWRGSSTWYRGGRTMKSLKEESKYKCRNYYRQEIAKYKQDNDHEVVIRKRFGDILDFT